MINEEGYEQPYKDGRILAVSNFILSAKENPDINHYIIDGQHRSGNNFWNSLFAGNVRNSRHKLLGESFHNTELYKTNHTYNVLDNVYNIVPFREPWEAIKSYLVLTNQENSATYESVYGHLTTCDSFYDFVNLKSRNIIPIELGFGSNNSRKIVEYILSLNKHERYTSFEDMYIDQGETLRQNRTPVHSKEKIELMNRAESLMNTPEIINHVAELSKKYYAAKLYAREYWLERGI
jgi:hypothetical protein